jgi:hypothetical protein
MISLTMQGISKSIDYYYGCGYVDYDFEIPRRLPDMLYELGSRFAGEPK